MQAFVEQTGGNEQPHGAEPVGHRETTMRLVRKTALALLAMALMGGAAAAADAIAIPVASQAQVPLYDDVAFDWNGFYAGVYGVGQVSTEGGTEFGLGANLGVNAQFDYFLVGGEVTLQGLTGDTVDTIYGQVVGRAGFVVTDEVLLYAAAGYGHEFGAPVEDDFLLGGGVEFAITDNVSLRAQYLHGFPITGDNTKDQITLGAQFHF
jgi:outer membrane immunogenic protein